MDKKKITEVFADQKFIEEILAMETPGEVRQALAERGVDLSEEEILSIRNRIVQMQEGCEEELSEEEMEDVAGGFIFPLIAAAVGAIAGAAIMVDSATRRRW